MKKSKLFLILVLLVTIFFGPVVNAEEGKVGKIIGNYNYGEQKLVNADVAIYQIGTVSATVDAYTYEFFEDFKDEKVDYAKLNYDQLQGHIKKIHEIVIDKGIQPLARTKTDNNGQFVFDGLKDAVYLIVVDDLTVDKDVYRSLPTLLFFPDVGEDGNLLYDVSLNIKTEIVKPSDNGDNTGSTTGRPNDGVDSPNTYDAIIMYVSLFVVSSILLAVLICYIYIYNKKKGKSNSEKDK